MKHELISRLAEVRRRLRQQWWGRRLMVFSLFVLLLFALLCISTVPISRPAIYAVGIAVTVTVAIIIALSFRRYRSWNQVAQRVEQSFPDLSQGLLTAIRSLQAESDRPAGYLQQSVMEQVIRHGKHHDWASLVSSTKLWRDRLITVVTLGLVSAMWWHIHQRQSPVVGGLSANGQRRKVTSVEVLVHPGDAEIERGRPLIVSARFPATVPTEAMLWIDADGLPAERIAMQRSLDDPLFVMTLPQVNQAAAYRIEFADLASPEYHLRVFDYPEMVQADAALSFPDYTNLPDKLVNDTRRISAVEGSQLTWIMRLNKPVAEAWFLDVDGRRIDLEPRVGDSLAYEHGALLDEDQQLTLHLLDEAGRTNQHPVNLLARRLPNRLPQLKPTVARDLSVSPLEELTVAASAWDDFGVTRYGVAYSFGHGGAREALLGQNVAAQTEAVLTYELSFEALQAKPDQMLAYHFWAEDIGPDGQPRRVQSDLYLADVRPFEEVFRQGQSPAGGQAAAGQPAQPAEQLLKLQKQIIVATWNLQRHPEGEPKGESFLHDSQLLVDAQDEARSQLESQSSKISDPEAGQIVQKVLESMVVALRELREAVSRSSALPLQSALQAEQESYQGLLSLRDREHEIARSSDSATPGAGGGSARRRQLEELDLDRDVNRYETERQASPPNAEDQDRKELRQILSRLRDLARRQEDVNRQMRELQLALQQDVSPERREELERHLRRLRDQQEQLLRDADETQERIEQARNQPQLQNTRQRLEDSRSELQQSSQAASAGDMSGALAAGTRAERQFQEMTDQLRQQAAHQFNQQMKQLRNAAVDLENSQRQIAKQMAQEADSSPGLRPGKNSAPLQEELLKQHADLEQLMEQMKQTIQEAEVSEPLLAQKLYDSHRRAIQHRVPQQLEDARRLLEGGRRDDAAGKEQSARAGLAELSEGIEDAARGILGNEVEGLRRAAQQLAELTEQLQQELERLDAPADGAMTSADPSVEPSNGEHLNGTPADSRGTSQSTSGQSSGGSESEPDEGYASPEKSRGQSPGQAAGRSPSGTAATEGARDGTGLVESLSESLGSGPIAGDTFGPWSDGLRDVEEMVDDAEIRARAAQIRDRARNLRRDMKRRSVTPQWDVVREMIATPLYELKQYVDQELARRSGQRDQLVPIDRDPVPPQFDERVREYYERLGQGR